MGGKKVTRKFKSGGLHERHVVTTWRLGNHLKIRLWTQGNQEKPVSRWPVAGPSGYWLLASSPASKVKQQYTHSITYTHKMTIHTRQIQLTKMHIRKTTPREESTVYTRIFWYFSPHILHSLFYPRPSLLTTLLPICTLPITLSLHPFPTLHFTLLPICPYAMSICTVIARNTRISATVTSGRGKGPP